MRILCIDDSNNHGKHKCLTIGDIYESSMISKNADGENCYLIPALPNSHAKSGIENNAPLYRVSRFIELDNDVETEQIECELLINNKL